MAKSPNVKISPPPKDLQMKVGTGTVPKEKIAQLQKVIDDAPVDFSAMAGAYLQELKTVLDKGGDLTPSDIKAILRLVMDLKGNSTMFGYPMVGAVSEVMLNFLERLKNFDGEALSLVSLFYQTLTALLAADIKGQSNPAGQKLLKELGAACVRYQKKYPDNIKS